MARMPSTRRLPLAPAFVPQAAAHVPPAVAVQPPVIALVPTPAVVVSVAPGGTVAVAAAQPETDDFEAAAAAARAGGFHESSYELRLGLEVSESAWPDDALPRDWQAKR